MRWRWGGDAGGPPARPSGRCWSSSAASSAQRLRSPGRIYAVAADGALRHPACSASGVARVPWNGLTTRCWRGLVSTQMPLPDWGRACWMNRLGYLYDIGHVLLFRMLVRDRRDARESIRARLISIPVAAVIFVEWMTRRNMFSIFGGGPYYDDP